MVGLVVQPLFIAPMLNLIQGETTASSCLLQVTTIFFFNVFCFSSFVSPVPRNCGSVNRHQTSLYLHSNRYQNPCTDYHYFCMGIDYNFKTSCRSLIHWRETVKSYCECYRIFTHNNHFNLQRDSLSWGSSPWKANSSSASRCSEQRYSDDYYSHKRWALDWLTSILFKKMYSFTKSCKSSFELI